MSSIQANASEVQFVVGEDVNWSEGPQSQVL